MRAPYIGHLVAHHGSSKKMTIYDSDALVPNIGPYLTHLSTTGLRTLARDIGVKPKGTSRASIANAIAESKQGHELSALITGIMRLASKAGKAHYHASWTREQDNMFGRARDGERRGMIYLLATGFITLAQTLDLFHKADIEVYGDTIINADVRVAIPNMAANIYPNVS